MPHRLVAAVGRVLRTRPPATHAHPHFHQGAQGNPAACFAPGCTSPRLEA
jgi:hypothetical protein